MSLFVCLSVCLLATLRKNSRTDLREIFREGWQWATKQIVKFWWRSRSIPNPDPDYGSVSRRGKTCLGGCMHCPNASNFCPVLETFIEQKHYSF